MIKTEELNSLSPEELTQKVFGFKRELFDLRMQQAGGKLDKPHRVREIRRDVARILTILRSKEKEK